MAHPDRKRFIASHNPNREQLAQAVDWSQLVVASEAIPSVISSVLREMKREGVWLPKVEPLFETFKQGVAHAFWIDPNSVVLRPDLPYPPPHTRETLGSADTEQQNGRDLYVIHLIELRFLDYLERLTHYEQNKLRKRPAELSKLRDEWLSVRIVDWLDVLIH